MTDSVAVTISPRWNSICTSEAGVDADLVGEVGQRGATRRDERSRRCPCGPACRRSSGPPWPRTPGDARASTCGRDGRDRPDDRTRPGSDRAGRDDRHRGGHRHWDRTRRVHHRDRHDRAHHRGHRGRERRHRRHRDPAHHRGHRRDHRGRHLDRHGPDRGCWDRAESVRVLRHHRRVGTRHARDDPGRAGGRGPAGPALALTRRRARGDAPCPGWARTGCCPDAGCRSACRPVAAREPSGSGPWAPHGVGAAGLGRLRLLGGRRRLDLGRGGRGRGGSRLLDRSGRLGRSGLGGLRLGTGLGGRGLLGRRLGGGLGSRLHLRQQLGTVGVLELLDRRQLDARGSCLCELADSTKLLQRFLAGDAVLLREFGNSGLGHVSPSGPRPLSGVSQTVVGCCRTNWLIARYSSSAHELLLQSLSGRSLLVVVRVEVVAHRCAGQPTLTDLLLAESARGKAFRRTARS